MIYNIIHSYLFDLDLIEIIEYYLGCDYSSYAKKIYRIIEDRKSKIMVFPRMFEIYESKGNIEYRRFIVDRKFVVIYHVDDENETIYLLKMYSTKSNYLNYFK